MSYCREPALDCPAIHISRVPLVHRKVRGNPEIRSLKDRGTPLDLNATGIPIEPGLDVVDADEPREVVDDNVRLALVSVPPLRGAGLDVDLRIVGCGLLKRSSSLASTGVTPKEDASDVVSPDEFRGVGGYTLQIPVISYVNVAWDIRQIAQSSVATHSVPISRAIPSHREGPQFETRIDIRASIVLPNVFGGSGGSCRFEVYISRKKSLELDQRTSSTSVDDELPVEIARCPKLELSFDVVDPVVESWSEDIF